MATGVRDLAAGISLANLCYLRLWAELFVISERGRYFVKAGPQEILAAILSVVVLGLLFAAGAQLARRASAARIPARVAFLFVLFLLLSNLGRDKEPGLLYLVALVREGDFLRVVALSALALAGSAAVLVWRDRFFRAAPTVLLALSPFVVVTFGRAASDAWTLSRSGHIPEGDAPVPGSAPAAPDGPAVVLMIFDGMGRRMAFENRPEGVRMPSFDRLRAESVEARDVVAVNTATARVLPALLSGVIPLKTKADGASDLRLTLAGGREVLWSETDTLFDEALRLGGRASVVGWYHPYCRVFDGLSECAWYSSTTGHGRIAETSIFSAAYAEIAALDPYTVHRVRQIRSWRALLDGGKRVVSTRGRGFVLVHLNIPHSPPIWNAARQRASAYRFDPRHYADSLEQADAALAELRAAMETAGTWETSTVIVTADHPSKEAAKAFGVAEDTIPLFVKLPGQKTGATQEKRLSAAFTYELAKWLLAEPVTDPAAVVAWLDAPPVKQ